MKLKFKENKNLYIYIVIFLFYFFLGFIMPFVHDDWAWGSQIGIDRLKSFYSNYNGRWMGNMFAIILNRSRILRALVYGLSVVIIQYFMMKIIKTKNSTLLYISSILILLMPHSFFRQTFAWTSGFVNYILPIAFLMPIIYVSNDFIEFSILDTSINEITLVEEKLDFLINKLYKNNTANRFSYNKVKIKKNILNNIINKLKNTRFIN